MRRRALRPLSAALLSLLLLSSPIITASKARKSSKRASAAAAASAAAPSDDEWDARPLKSLDTTTCSVERVAAVDLTPQRFAQEYRGKKPVVITGLTDGDGAHDVTAQQRPPSQLDFQGCSLTERMHDGLHVKFDGFRTKNDGFHMKADGFHAENDGFGNRTPAGRRTSAGRRRRFSCDFPGNSQHFSQTLFGSFPTVSDQFMSRFLSRLLSRLFPFIPIYSVAGQVW